VAMSDGWAVIKGRMAPNDGAPGFGRWEESNRPIGKSQKNRGAYLPPHAQPSPEGRGRKLRHGPGLAADLGGDRAGGTEARGKDEQQATDRCRLAG